MTCQWVVTWVIHKWLKSIMSHQEFTKESSLWVMTHDSGSTLILLLFKKTAVLSWSGAALSVLGPNKPWFLHISSIEAFKGTLVDSPDRGAVVAIFTSPQVRSTQTPIEGLVRQIIILREMLDVVRWYWARKTYPQFQVSKYPIPCCAARCVKGKNWLLGIPLTQQAASS